MSDTLIRDWRDCRDYGGWHDYRDSSHRLGFLAGIVLTVLQEQDNKIINAQKNGHDCVALDSAIADPNNKPNGFEGYPMIDALAIDDMPPVMKEQIARVIRGYMITKHKINPYFVHVGFSFFNRTGVAQHSLWIAFSEDGKTKALNYSHNAQYVHEAWFINTGLKLKVLRSACNWLGRRWPTLRTPP